MGAWPLDSSVRVLLFLGEGLGFTVLGCCNYQKPRIVSVLNNAKESKLPACRLKGKDFRVSSVGFWVLASERDLSSP